MGLLAGGRLELAALAAATAAAAADGTGVPLRDVLALPAAGNQHTSCEKLQHLHPYRFCPVASSANAEPRVYQHLDEKIEQQNEIYFINEPLMVILRQIIVIIAAFSYSFLVYVLVCKGYYYSSTKIWFEPLTY